MNRDMEPMKDCGTQCVPFKNPTLTEQLNSERTRLIDRLKDVEAALYALDASPEAQKVVDAIARLGNYR